MTTGNVQDLPGVSAPGLVFALSRLVSGKADAIAFVEIGPESLYVRALGMDADSVPVLYPEASPSVPWTAILTGLLASDGEPAATQALELQLRRLTEDAAAAGGSPDRQRRLDIVLVNRSDGQTWPEAAAKAARAALRPIAEVMAAPGAVKLAKVITALAEQAPLRYGYALVLIDVDRQTRAVRPLAHDLFPAGSSVLLGTRSEKAVTVSPVTDHAAKVLALPVVERRGTVLDMRDTAAVAEHLPLVTMATLGSRYRRSVEVRVRLARGRPQILAPGDVTAAGPGWPEVLEELPDQLSLRNSPWALASPEDLDVAVLVELGGAADAVATRVRVARGIVGKFPNGPAVRIGVLGYRDHYGSYQKKLYWKPGGHRDALVIGARLNQPSEAAAVLERSRWWDAAPIVCSYAAPVEDALQELLDDEWGWRTGARHAIVILGRRPPHPDQNPAHEEENLPYGFDLRPCAYAVKWQEALSQLSDKLSDQYKVEYHVVLDQPPVADYDVRTWKAFGESQTCLKRDSAKRIARDLGLVPPPDIPLAMHQPLVRLTSGKRVRRAGR